MSKLQKFIKINLFLVVILLLVLSVFKNNFSETSSYIELNGKKSKLILTSQNEIQKLSSNRSNEITISIWVMIYYNENITQNPIVTKSGNMFYLTGESRSNKAFTWIVWDNQNRDYYAIDPDDYQVYRWYNVVGVWNQNMISLYVNGILKDNITIINPIIENDGNWIIGNNYNNSSLKGAVSNIQIYKKALNSTEIELIYKNGRIIKTISQNNLVFNNMLDDLNLNSIESYIGANIISLEIYKFPFNFINLLLSYLFPLLLLFYFFSTMFYYINKFIQSNSIYLKYENIYFYFSILIKTIVAFLTPLSFDFLNIVHTSTFQEIPIGITPEEGGPIFLLYHLMYRIWNLLPINKPNILAVHSYPFDLHYSKVLLTPGNYLIPYFFGEGAEGMFMLFYYIKFINILFDILIGFVIFLVIQNLTNNVYKSKIALIFWLFNPYTFLICEMWSSVDIVMIVFVLLSALYFYKKRYLLSSIFLGISTSIRLLPIILLPLFIFSIHDNKNNKHISIKKIFTFTIDDVFNNLNILKMLLYIIIFSLTFIFISIPSFIDPTLPLFPTTDPLVPSNLLYSRQSYSIQLGLIISSLFGLRVSLPIFFMSFLFMISITKINFSSYNIFFIITSFLLSYYAFSQWNPHYLFWLYPFIIITTISINIPKIYPTFFLIFSFFINAVEFGYYYSTQKYSVLFFPVINNILQIISNNIFNFRQNPLIIFFEIPLILFSSFSGICLAFSFFILHYLYKKSKEDFE